MNKIIIENEKIIKEDESILIEENKIIFTKDIDVKLIVNSNTNLIFEINPNISVSIKEITENMDYNKKTEYHIKGNSNLKINKFLVNKNVSNNDTIYLEGEKAKVDFLLRTISQTQETHIVTVNHMNSNTDSNVVLRGVSKETGIINFKTTGIVPKNIINCKVNQDNRIYTFNQNKCTIEPILLIDNNDVEANHAAFIGKFDDEVIFYLMSRGISKNECMHLLVKGFLGIDNDEEVLSIIHKYWR